MQIPFPKPGRPIYPKLSIKKRGMIMMLKKRIKRKKNFAVAENRECLLRRNRNFQNLYLIPLPIPRIYSPWIHAVTRTRDNNSQLPIRVSLDWRVNRDINHARTGRRFELNDQSRKPVDSIKLELSNARSRAGGVSRLMIDTPVLGRRT